METSKKHLLILDLDETLVHATDAPLAHDPDVVMPPYVLYFRPGVKVFLEQVSRHFDLAVWTSSSPLYAQIVTDILFADPASLAFVWARDRCTPHRDIEHDIWCHSKPLHKVKRRGYDLRRVLAVDDSPEKYTRNYGNLIQIAPFMGDADDRELSLLAIYLEGLAHEPDVRCIEKRGWRKFFKHK